MQASEAENVDLFHFILRLPSNIASKLQNDIDLSEPLEDKFFIQFDENRRQAEIVYENELLHGRIMDLPCIVEMLKSLDRKTFYKSGDIGQIMICSQNKSSLPEIKFPIHALNQENLDKQHQFNRGLTPPLKNVRAKRFRKTLKKKTMDWMEVEREVKKLIRDDLLAEKVEWELLYTDEDVSAAMNANLGREPVAGESVVQSIQAGGHLTRLSSQDKLNQLFGELSDSEEDEEEELLDDPDSSRDAPLLPAGKEIIG